MTVRYSVTEDIAPVIATDPDLARLHHLFQERREGDALPRANAVSLGEFAWCMDHLMLLERQGDDFVHLYFGISVVSDGFRDMTGKSTRDFDTHLGDFFRLIYTRCVELGRPLYTVHRDSQAPTVFTWERLLLPLADARGDVVRILVFSRPLTFRHELLTRVLESSPAAILSLEPVRDVHGSIEDFLILLANPAAVALTESHACDLVDHRLVEALPHLAEDLMPALAQVCEEGAPLDLEDWFRIGESEVCLHVTANWTGSGLTTTFSDVTPLKLQELALQETNGRLRDQAALLQQHNDQIASCYQTSLLREELLRLFVEHAPAAVAMFDTNMCYLLHSRRWLSDYGLTGEDIVGRSHFDVFPDAPAAWRDHVRRCLAGEVFRRDEDVFHRADGTTLYLNWELRPWHDADGAIGGLIKLSEVVTDEVIGRRQLEERTRLLEDAESLAGIGHWRLDVKSRRLFWSDGIFRIHGREPDGDPIVPLDEAIGLCHHADRAMVGETFETAIRDRTGFEVEHRLVHANGKARHVVNRGRVELDDEGKLVALFGTLMDVTERHETARQLSRQAEQLQEKNRRLAKLYDTAYHFVDNVSHEFRTPLTVIREFASILRDGVVGEISDDQGELLDAIVSRAEDLGMMVDDMLDISRLESGTLKVARRATTIEALIDDVYPTLAGRAGARSNALQLTVDDDLPVLFCDGAKAGRVIINLVANALKFSPDDSTVTVWARNGGDHVRIGVTDHGPGIAPDQAELIFQRFKQGDGAVRSSTKGFGLGLNIARELVRLNLGEIGLETRQGEGSTFWFTLPAAEPVPVLRRMLDRLDPEPEAVSIGILTGFHEDGGAVEFRLDDFLHEHIRPDDLLFPAGEQRWVLAVAGGADEVNALIERAAVAYERAGQGRVGGPLPQFDLVPLHSFVLADQRDELVRFWSAMTSGNEPLRENADAA